MTGFDLPQNFHSDPESLLRRTRAHLVSSRSSLSVNWAQAHASKAQFTNRLTKQTTQAIKDITRYETKQGRAKL